jgi:hypothetical protein
VIIGYDIPIRRIDHSRPGALARLVGAHIPKKVIPKEVTERVVTIFLFSLDIFCSRSSRSDVHDGWHGAFGSIHETEIRQGWHISTRERLTNLLHYCLIIVLPDFVILLEKGIAGQGNQASDYARQGKGQYLLHTVYCFLSKSDGFLSYISSGYLPEIPI